jgi:hypothetical protein
MVLVALSGQTPAAPTLQRHLVYEFGYNARVASSGTNVATSGPGTGTTTIDIYGPAADGGLTISASDFWWNTPRARATNTCEVYPNGSVICDARPYAISPIQLTIFPLLARGYFKGIAANQNQQWSHTFQVKAAILPGGSTGFTNAPITWNATYTLTGKGPMADSKLTLVQSTGTLVQDGGHYLSLKSTQRIAYDRVAKVPAFVSEQRTHYPQRNVYNNDLIELKLVKLSPATP